MSAQPSVSRTAGGILHVSMTLRAGQTVIVRDGVSGFGKLDPAVELSYRLDQPPGCGVAKEAPSGIILHAKPECTGHRLEFSYVISLRDSYGERVQAVEVSALIERGFNACGLEHAPFRFVPVPGGVYSLENLPARLADISGLVVRREVKVKAFCITEDAISADELAAFLANTTLAEKLKAFPEALAAGSSLKSGVETGSVPPATGVSFRMAKAFAENASARLSRTFSLPTLDEYIAANLYLEHDKSDISEAQIFAVSLRGGLIEWTETPCEKAPDTFVTIGTDQLHGRLTMFCYEPAQRVSRLTFRLILEPVDD